MTENSDVSEFHAIVIHCENMVLTRLGAVTMVSRFKSGCGWKTVASMSPSLELSEVGHAPLSSPRLLFLLTRSVHEGAGIPELRQH